MGGKAWLICGSETSEDTGAIYNLHAFSMCMFNPVLWTQNTVGTIFSSLIRPCNRKKNFENFRAEICIGCMMSYKACNSDLPRFLEIMTNVDTKNTPTPLLMGR